MGIMSKGNQRLSERPLPPSAAERDEDVQAADETDVVYSLGQKYMTEYYKVSPSTTPTNESPSHSSSTTTTTTSGTTTSNTSSLNASTASTDSEEIVSQEQVNESYDDVVKLLTLYSSLKDVPSELEGKYSKLKTTADELSGSISELRALSLNFGISDAGNGSKVDSANGASSSSSVKKGKIKPKKKT